MFDVIGGLGSMLSSTPAWIVVIGVAAVLLLWNGGRNLTCWFLFVGSVLPIPLIAGRMSSFSDYGQPFTWMDLPPLIAGVGSIVLLLASALLNGWALARRAPLRDEFGALVFLGVGYGPVVVFLSAWALVIVVLALIGF